MKKSAFKLIALISVFSVFIAITGSSANATPVEKVVICHIPPGNPDNMHTIAVGEPAVDAHLDHGDSLSYCWGDSDVSDYVDETITVINATIARSVRIYSMRSIQGR